MATTKNGIVYPDNYDKVADVPADLKEMAESVDENIEQINEKIKQNSNNIESLQADNTTNKKSIEELKQKNAEQDESIKTNASEIEELKQENIEIKAENERLRDDIKNVALVGEERGESIDLEDSSEARVNKFEIKGNHKQDGEPELDNPVEIKTVKDNINEVICNKNIFEILDLEEKWKYTEKGIKNLYANAGIKISQLNLKKGKTVELGFKLLSKVNNDITFTIFVNDKTGIISPFANIQNYKVNTLYKRSYTATDDCTIKIVLYGNADSEIFEFQLWAEYNQLSEYIRHQSQSIAMPVQQEMLDGDCFDWENEKEVHKWTELILDGTEKIRLSNNNISFVYDANNNIKILTNDVIPPVASNSYKTATWRDRNEDNTKNTISMFASSIGFDKGDLTTVDEFKAMLKSKHDAGNAVVIYYELETPIELAFTDEQKAIAKQIKQTLHTYKNITHIYSEDEISPKIDIEYAKDLNTVINNIQAQIINNASEEV